MQFFALFDPWPGFLVGSLRTDYILPNQHLVSSKARENALLIIEFPCAVLNWNYAAKRFRCSCRCQGRFHLTISSKLLFFCFFGIPTCRCRHHCKAILNRFSLPHEKKKKKVSITVPAGNIFSNNNNSNTRHETDNKLNYKTSKIGGNKSQSYEKRFLLVLFDSSSTLAIEQQQQQVFC